MPAGGSRTVRLRLSASKPNDPFAGFEKTFDSRIADADEFYQRIAPETLNEDQRRVHRQALAGMLWSKQFYYFDLERWLREHKSHPLDQSARPGVRNTEWFHMLNADIISMPDKWEYPWYAAWDLAFHTTTLALVDFDFAKEQLLLMLRNLYAHPNGQIPAYEWNFGDVNPPVHAWATLYLYKMEKTLGRADMRFLERSFQGLMLNFNWWVNRKDPSGKNVFAGGFLGLDNIGVFDRSAQLPTGGSLEQADGTAWMAFYCQCMLEMSLILSEYDPMYEEVAFKFVQHFMWISYAMDRIGDNKDEMWDEQDGFFYDLLRLPGRPGHAPEGAVAGRAAAALRVHGVRRETRSNAPSEADGDDRAVPETSPGAACRTWRRPTRGTSADKGRRLLSILNKKKLVRVLGYMLDENEFLGPHGIRSLSRYHLDHPFMFWVGDQEFKVQYLPAESNTGHVRRELQLAGAGVDAGQRADHPGAVEPVSLLRRRLQGRVPDRFRPVHDAVRGGSGAGSPDRRHVPPRQRRAEAGLRRERRSSRTIRTGATCSCSTSTSTATTAPGSAPATRPAGPAWSPSCWTSSGGVDAKALLESERSSLTDRVMTEQVGRKDRGPECDGPRDRARREGGEAGRRLRVHRGADVRRGGQRLLHRPAERPHPEVERGRDALHVPAAGGPRQRHVLRRPGPPDRLRRREDRPVVDRAGRRRSP